MSQYINILSVNVSMAKGIAKTPVNQIRLNSDGIVDNAPSESWHRLVSLLGKESFDRFAKMAGKSISFGGFAENITTEGLELINTLPLDRFSGGGVELEITHIGKECHGNGCVIFKEANHCAMSKEGIFARVIKPGILKPGDVLQYIPKVYRIHVVTLSDRAFRGDYEDRSGPRVVELINDHFSSRSRKIQVETSLIPDDQILLRGLIDKALNRPADIFITTGGTGVGTRDITVDTIKPFLTKEVPGIMEMIRTRYGAQKPNALLSRSIAGFAGNTLVYTLPGSVKAVNEYMEEILKTLEHLIYMRYGLDAH